MSAEAATTYETILTEHNAETGVYTITMNRPGVLNALNRQMRLDLLAALDAAEADESVAVVLLQAEGRAFSAGDDLKEGFDRPVTDHTVLKRRAAISFESLVCMRIFDFPKPVIAAVQGYCLGAGCDLSLACDITVAADDLQIGEPEIRQVSMPPTLLMPWLVGMKKTKLLLLTGDIVGAEEAERIGLVSMVVPAVELWERARTLAERLARVPRETLVLNKLALNRTLELAGLREGVSSGIEIGTLIQMLKSVEELQRRQEMVRQAGGLREFLKQRDAGF